MSASVSQKKVSHIVLGLCPCPISEKAIIFFSFVGFIRALGLYQLTFFEQVEQFLVLRGGAEVEIYAVRFGNFTPI